MFSLLLPGKRTNESTPSTQVARGNRENGHTRLPIEAHIMPRSSTSYRSTAWMHGGGARPGCTAWLCTAWRPVFHSEPDDVQFGAEDERLGVRLVLDIHHCHRLRTGHERLHRLRSRRARQPAHGLAARQLTVSTHALSDRPKRRRTGRRVRVAQCGRRAGALIPSRRASTPPREPRVTQAWHGGGRGPAYRQGQSPCFACPSPPSPVW